MPLEPGNILVNINNMIIMILFSIIFLGIEVGTLLNYLFSDMNNKNILFFFDCHLLLNHSERTEPVTSKQLRELFNSFEIKIPPDPKIKSFAGGIVLTDVHNLVTTVNSLSHGVVFPTNRSSYTVLIFEMEVVYDHDQLWVVKKVSLQHICYIFSF